MAGFSFGTPTTSAPSFSLGSNTNTGGTPGFNFGATPSVTNTAPSLQFNAPATSSGSITFGASATQGSSGFTFGAPPTTQSALQFKPGATQQPTFGLGTTPASTALTFGSTPTTTQPVLNFGSSSTTTQPLSFSNTPTATNQSLSFGSTPATTSLPLSFGNTPAATSQPISFGSNPATTSQALSFGNTTAAATQPISFGSTPTTTAQPLSFGNTPTATIQPIGFGSTPATTSQPLSFGSTPASTSQPLSFGSTPAASAQPLSFGSTSQPSLSFGTGTVTTQAGLNFSSAPTTTQTTINFGLSTPATSASTSFNLGAPSSTGAGLATKPTLTFGNVTTTAASTTAATSSLLNFSTPKTTTSAGFSLSVSSGTTGGSLFSVPTTSAPTTSAPATFKGLGGVDTSTTQGSGQKDAKSVKENIVNQEIMQTLDTFKNFVKQQKNLSCEVSRAPVKPMHKVTEDTDALKQLLTSVSSALQKNRVIANKLKTDTTKCLSLCEMAQRTHDTPPGLQNDNIAPVEFFIQLVSKFEKDIQVLRQEIDNTEKHVNSLSYPAILTPQELSVALRRLHDSFVALAGRLQTAHAGVIAQKERHLSLRRHFLKDHTNIFENSSRTTSTVKKPPCANILPMTGPTPFSSMGGIHNINLINQDKPVTFSSGTSALSGWGSSAISSLNPSATSNLLQSSGTSVLNSPQPVDNQSFQLGKPPPGNKRGKR